MLIIIDDDAGKGPGVLVHPGWALTVIAVLVKRAGGKVVLTQAEFDQVQGLSMGEEMDADAQTLTITTLGFTSTSQIQ